PALQRLTGEAARAGRVNPYLDLNPCHARGYACLQSDYSSEKLHGQGSCSPFPLQAVLRSSSAVAVPEKIPSRWDAFPDFGGTGHIHSCSLNTRTVAQAV